MSFSSVFSGHPEGNLMPASGGSCVWQPPLLGPFQVTLETFPYNAIVLFFARTGARLSFALCLGSLSGCFSIGICNFQCCCIFCGKHGIWKCWNLLINMEMLKFTDLMLTMILCMQCVKPLKIQALFPQHFGLQRPKSIVDSRVLLK